MIFYSMVTLGNMDENFDFCVIEKIGCVCYRKDPVCVKDVCVKEKLLKFILARMCHMD